MKVISIETGRVLQLFVPDEIKPSGGIYLPELIKLVTERYGFTKPATIEMTDKGGAKFEYGQLISGSRKVNLREVGIYNDGVIIVADNTTDADFATDDALMWARHAFNLREPDTKIPRRYTSQVVVEFEKPIDSALKAFDGVRRQLAETLKRSQGIDAKMDILKIGFNADPMSVPPLLNTEFLIERRLQQPYSKNRFFCTAQLRTEEHIKLLENFETSALS